MEVWGTLDSEETKDSKRKKKRKLSNRKKVIIGVFSALLALIVLKPSFSK